MHVCVCVCVTRGRNGMGGRKVESGKERDSDGQMKNNNK